MLAIGALAGVSIMSAAERATNASQARALVALGGTSTRLVTALQQERAAAALVFAEASGKTALADYQRQSSVTDTASTAYIAERADTELPADLVPVMERIDRGLAGLAALRKKVTTSPDAVLSTVAFAYRAVIADLLTYQQALGQIGVSAASGNGLRSVAALSTAIESTSQLQVVAVRALASDRLTPAVHAEIVAAGVGSTEALQTFVDLGDPSWQGLLNSRIGGGPQILAAERLQGLVTRAQPGAALELGTNARGWSAAVGTRISRMHAVEAELDSQLLADVTAERDAELRTIVVSSSVVTVLLLVVVLLGLGVARSLAGSLSRLQAAALEVATSRLPRMVEHLDVDNADPSAVARLLATAAEPIPVDGEDEVAQVATAFNIVAASAVQIAGEQAALRAGIGAILVSLSRRLQKRADAMMASLDKLEQKEMNPERLEKLFELDHTATLIRRLIFNLQILASGRGGRPRDGMVPLADLLRGALGEIQDYTRVQLSDVEHGVHISGEVADELTHLLAELLENATRFSPPHSAVVVDARHVGDLLHVQISDTGTGMSEAQLAAARDRIAHPRRLDERVTQQMGLPVVGAIAMRHGIKVDFRTRPETGTTVDLTVPRALFEHIEPPVPEQPAPAPAPAGVLAPVHEATRELTTVPAAGVTPQPPPWPLPAGHVAATAAPAKALIFDRLQQSWFDPNRPGAQPSTAPAREPAPAVRTQGAAEPVKTTTSGLPIRPRRLDTAPLEPVTRPMAPVQRVPEQVRRQMSAFQNGLSQAGRRSFHSVHLISEGDPR
ncbi:sensor histidine kinase [Actinoplanes philippinensis]|uniref:sensor histidine kinase n=1 Tax=Actinoplanes philippinensis TaxID=35752 RepID=UPI0033FB618D